MPLRPTEKIPGLEEQIAQCLRDISTKDIKQKSDLTDEEILNLSLIYTWAETINCKILKDFANNFLKLRVSKERMGRREIVIIASAGGEIGERRRFRSLRDLFAGLR